MAENSNLTSVVRAAAALTIAMLSSHSAMAAPNPPYLDYVGGIGAYETAGNWAQASPGSSHVPGSGTLDQAAINSGQVTLSSDVSANLSFGTIALMINYRENNGTTAPVPGTAFTIASGGKLNLNGIQAFVGLGSTFNIIGNGTADSAQASIGRLEIGRLKNGSHTFGDATLNVNNGGRLNANDIFVGKEGGVGRINLGPGGFISGGNTHKLFLGENGISGSGVIGSKNLIEQTGGTLEIQRVISLGINGASNYNLSAGTLTQREDGQDFIVSSSGASQFNITGGSATIGKLRVGNVASATTDGLVAVSGALPLLKGRSLRVGNADGLGSGIFRVSGSGTNAITFTEGGAASPLITYSNSTLNFQIDSGGVRKIIANSTANGDQAKNAILLNGVLDMDLLLGFTPAANQIFDLIATNSTFNGIGNQDPATGLNITNGIYNNLTFAAGDSANWKMLKPGDTGYVGGTLAVQYIGPVPEPTMLGLMALPSFALLRRGRRRSA